MPLSHMLRLLLLATTIALLTAGAQAGPRMEKILARGELVCGVAADDPGFSQRSADGVFTGLEADMCRALAAAVLGSAQQLRLVPLETVHDFLADVSIDIVFHRLSWAVTREAPGQLEFGPVYFFETANESLEMLAPLLRSDDLDFSRVVRWSIYALIAAEEHGVNQRNVGQTEVRNRWLLGEAGQALGLHPDWAYRMVSQVGNYGEIFERNLGPGRAQTLQRGPNRLWRDGGLLLSPLLKETPKIRP
jgi:hypothetical protein